MRTTPPALLRTSFYVHWGALGTLVATVACAYYLPHGEQALTIAGYMGSITLVLLGWSAVLSLRARWNGDATRWWRVVPIFTMLELNVAVIGAYAMAAQSHPRCELLDGIIESGLPLFLPFFTIVGGVAVACGALIARLAHRKDDEPILAAQARRYTWRIGFVMTAVLLPIPLFLYCACPPGCSPESESGNESVYVRGWRAAIADAMPNVVRDAAVNCALSLPGGNVWSMLAILKHGRCSRAELFTHLYDPVYHNWHVDRTDREFAFEGLIRAYPRDALVLAHAFAQDKAGMAWSRSTALRSGECLAENGSIQDIQNDLGFAREPNFIRGLLNQLARDDRHEFAPDLFYFVERSFIDAYITDWCPGTTLEFVDPGVISETLAAESKLGEPGVFIPQWSRLLCDPKRRKLREFGSRCLVDIKPVRTRLQIVMNAWERADDEGKRLLLSERLMEEKSNVLHLDADDRAMVATWLTWLIAHSAHDDCVIRRAVANRLAEVTGISLHSTPQPYSFLPGGNEEKRRWNDADYQTETPAELQNRAWQIDGAKALIAEFATRVADQR